MGRGLVSILRSTFLCSVAGTIVLAQTGSTDLTRYVNTFVGTGQGAPDYNMGNAAGNTPPGAAYPYGMALWSPDTTTQSGGYRYEHRSINGFSLTHFSGRGISCWQDLPPMPVPGRVKGFARDEVVSLFSTRLGPQNLPRCPSGSFSLA